MSNKTIDKDVIVIGAGAAGMMCAMTAAQRGRKVTLIEHTKKIGEKIRISGGGRCNFTNLYSTHENFLSQNPHFCKSALSRFTPQDFLALVERHNIKWHEKCVHPNAKGQLFCDDSSKQIIDMLRGECEKNGAAFALEKSVKTIEKKDNLFLIHTESDTYRTHSLVIACGGLSIPKIGASDFGYRIAKQFGLNIIPTRAALVPLTFKEELLNKTKPLSGVSVDAKIKAGKAAFAEGMLFTHKGLSGPSILQASSYWEENTAIRVDMCPSEQIEESLKQAKKDSPKKKIQNILGQYIPQRLAEMITETHGVTGKNMADLSDKPLLHWPQTSMTGTSHQTAPKVTVQPRLQSAALIQTNYPRKPWKQKPSLVCISSAKSSMSQAILVVITSNGHGRPVTPQGRPFKILRNSLEKSL